jgi:glyoxylase-like metal-dependent hydrolase (beta-lactamase superfamily II)
MAPLQRVTICFVPLVEILPGVHVATSRNYQTTSTVVVSDHGTALVVDPAWDPDELDRIAKELRALNITVEVGVSTHFHFDHLLWHPDLGDAPRFASEKTVEIVGDQRTELLAMLGEDWPPDLGALFGDVAPLAADTGIPWSGPTATPIHHNAHALGHIAIWIADLSLLIAGDMLSDIELPLPAESDHGLPNYAAALDILEPFVVRAKLMIPGHGSPTDNPSSRLAADSAYLQALLSGDPSSDERLRNPGMAEAHKQNLLTASRPIS